MSWLVEKEEMNNFLKIRIIKIRFNLIFNSISKSRAALFAIKFVMLVFVCRVSCMCGYH